MDIEVTGDNAETKTADGGAETQKADTAPREEDKKVLLDEIHRWKNEAKSKEKLLKQQQEETLRKNQEWQKIAELKEQENIKLNEELGSLKGGLVINTKRNALKEAALKAGLRDVTDLNGIPLDDLAIETTSFGDYKVHGAEELVAKLKAQKAHWFSGPKTTTVNASSPGVVEGTRKTKEEAFEEWKKQREHYKKTGDPAPLRKALEEYKKYS